MDLSKKYWRSEWGYKIIIMISSHGSANSSGTCILFKNNFDLEITKYQCDSNGRFIIADNITEGEKITLVNLYAPDDDSPEFFDKVFDTLKEFDCESLIVC